MSQRTARLYQDNFLNIASAKFSSASEFSKSAENIPRLLEDNPKFNYKKSSVSYETLMLLIKTENDQKHDESLPRPCRRNGAIKQPDVIVLKTRLVDSLIDSSIDDLLISSHNDTALSAVVNVAKLEGTKPGLSDLLLEKELRQRRNAVDDFARNNARMDRAKLRVILKKF